MNLDQRLRSAANADQAKLDFLASLSHEIRTPMNGILGLSDLLADTKLNPDQADMARTIRDSARSLLGILDEVLDWSKMEAGRMELESCGFDLPGVFEDTADLFSGTARTKGVELVLDMDPGLPCRAIGDGGRLRQVLSNLLGNAVKFTDHGEVTIAVTTGGDEQELLICEVSDTGVGMSEAEMSSLFRAFSQAKGNHTRSFGGTGLGLAIAQNLVRMMGGDIQVESQVGKGSQFRFWIPLQMENVPEPSPIHPFLGKRALILEPNGSAAWTLKRRLEFLGVQASVVADTSAAALVLKNHAEQDFPLHYLFTASRLGSLDGAEICQSLLSRCEATPTLLVCAPLGEANQSGNLVVQKPLHQSSLRNLLHKLEGGSVEIQTQNLPQTPHQSLRILLAEDHPVNRKLAIRILESAGHQVRWAGDGAQALKMYQQEPFDLVILDMQMPVMDGVEAAERMRAFDKNKNRHTPILAMTANAFAEDRERCIKAGMDDYLAKPVRPQELLARIAAISAVLGSTARAG